MKAKSTLTLFVLLFLLGACSTSTSPVEQNNILTENIISELESILDRSMANSNTPGIVAGVFTDDGESWTATRGVSNIETDEPMNENCHFRIGSNTKTFVGTVVLQLVDEGLIELDKAISHYLPDLNIPSGDIITVRMLGNMTSGLADYTSDERFGSVAVSGEMIFTPGQLVYLACTCPLNFTPGSEFEYSNTNFVLLGMLIEKVTGKSVKENLEDRIFNRMKLRNTAWPITRFLPVPYAHGYARSYIDGTLHDFSFYQPSWMDAAGILISNMNDLKNYLPALTNGDLLTANSQLERDKYILAASTSAGDIKYGFAIENYWGWIGHTGQTPGYNTVMFRDPEKGVSIIVLANYQADGSDNPAENLFYHLSQIFE